MSKRLTDKEARARLAQFTEIIDRVIKREGKAQDIYRVAIEGDNYLQQAVLYFHGVTFRAFSFTVGSREPLERVEARFIERLREACATK